MTTLAKKQRLRLNDRWRQTFSRPQEIAKITEGQTRPSPDCGLLYFYIINEQVRYIGQTKWPIMKRMTRRFRSGLTGYKDVIRRKILEAHRRGKFRIVTCEVPISELDKTEIEAIKKYAPGNYLWNNKDNAYFKTKNYDKEIGDFYGLSFEGRVKNLIKSIPPGRVESFKQIATWSGSPARALGVAKIVRRGGGDLPWHRVVRSNGCLTPSYPGSRKQQREKLSKEGVKFCGQDQVSDMYRWSAAPFSRNDNEKTIKQYIKGANLPSSNLVNLGLR